MCNFSVPKFGLKAFGFEIPSPPPLPGFAVSIPGLALNLSLPTIVPFVPVFTFSLPSFPSIGSFSLPELGLALKLSLPALKAFIPTLFSIPSIPAIPGFSIPCPLE